MTSKRLVKMASLATGCVGGNITYYVEQALSVGKVKFAA
jgi:hypothetical protein